jgi:hypothetical protein
MSIEDKIEKLTDAINGLTAAIAASGGGMATPTADEAGKNPTSRGRRKATDTQDAGASGQQAESGSDSLAQTSTQDGADAPAGGAGTKAAVVDAGTGKPIETATVDRAAVKAKGVKLTQLNGGNDKLKELLVKHSPEGTEAVKFGTVPDEAMPAFEADIDEAIEQLSALAD